MSDGIDRQRTLAETQTAGFGLAGGKVLEYLVLEFDHDCPTITVRHDRVDYPDPFDDRDVRTTTIETETVTPTDDFDRHKVEIGTSHGQDRVIIETHDHAPRAYVRHERQDGGWTEQCAWELHPATGISQVAGETVADGGTVENGTGRTRVGHCKRDSTDVYAGRGPGGRTMLDANPGMRGWLGNPFPTDEFGREECIEQFRESFEAKLENDERFRRAVRGLAGKTLGCWCQSLDEGDPACHAEVIAEHADRLAAQSSTGTQQEGIND